MFTSASQLWIPSGSEAASSLTGLLVSPSVAGGQFSRGDLLPAVREMEENERVTLAASQVILIRNNISSWAFWGHCPEPQQWQWNGEEENNFQMKWTVTASLWKVWGRTWKGVL